MPGEGAQARRLGGILPEGNHVEGVLPGEREPGPNRGVVAEIERGMGRIGGVGAMRARV